MRFRVSPAASRASWKLRNNRGPGLSRPSHHVASRRELARGVDHVTQSHGRKAGEDGEPDCDVFLSQPEDIRIDGVATHINKFWEPRMRRRFFEMVDAGAGDFLPLVIAASREIRRPDAPAADAVGLGEDAKGAPGGKGPIAGESLSEPSVPETTRV